MLEKKSRKKLAAFALPLALCLAFGTGTVMASIFNSLQPFKIGTWSQEIQDTDFQVDQVKYNVQSLTKIRYRLVLENTDTATHSANVTITFQDSSENTLAEVTYLTGDVSGGQTHDKQGTATLTDVNQWTNTLINIEQLS